MEREILKALSIQTVLVALGVRQAVAAMREGRVGGGLRHIASVLLSCLVVSMLLL